MQTLYSLVDGDAVDARAFSSTHTPHANFHTVPHETDVGHVNACDGNARIEN
jgi:hypothetical protein